MTEKTVLIPDASHPITVEPNLERIVVSAAGQTIADISAALDLSEAGYPPVQYIPRSDVDLSALERTDHTTHCPYKGDASYYSIRIGDELRENAVWTYEAPHAAVAEIKDHLAFYPGTVELTASQPA